jgi:hypothetical protein
MRVDVHNSSLEGQKKGFKKRALAMGHGALGFGSQRYCLKPIHFSETTIELPGFCGS